MVLDSTLDLNNFCYTIIRQILQDNYASCIGYLISRHKGVTKQIKIIFSLGWSVYDTGQLASQATVPTMGNEMTHFRHLQERP